MSKKIDTIKAKEYYQKIRGNSIIGYTQKELDEQLEKVFTEIYKLEDMVNYSHIPLGHIINKLQKIKI